MTRLVVHGARLLDAEVDGVGWLVADDGVVAAVGPGVGVGVDGGAGVGVDGSVEGGVDGGVDGGVEGGAVGGAADATGWVRFAQTADDVVDAAGLTLTPGFVDLHGHGGGGSSYDEDAAAIRRALAVHRAHGTTRSVLSLVTNPLPALGASLRRIAEVARDDPTVLGAHLEGPFLAPGRRGAHDPAALLAPTPRAVDGLLEAAPGVVRQVTLAPELPEGVEAIRRFASSGVLVAVGHTEAGYDRAAEAFAAGATLLTHTFNAMPGLHHRDPGPVAAALDAPSVVLELIADGVHVHPSLVALLLGSAAHRVALITDAMAATGVGDGEYRLGGLRVTVREGRAVVAGTDTIAGSTLTQDRALRLAVGAGVPPRVAVAALTATPADVLGLGHRFGRLRAGHVADLVLLDHTWSVHDVWVAGTSRSLS